MSEFAAHEPLSVGVIGLSPDGLHLIEAMSSGGPFRVVLAWDDQPHLANAAISLGVPVATDLKSLLGAAEVEVIWLARPGSFDKPFADLLLRSRKSIVSELPLGLSAGLVESALATARSQGVPVLSHAPRRLDENFRRAQSVVRSGELGTMHLAKWISWSYGLSPGSPSDEKRIDDESQSVPSLLRLLAHAIDQLLQLIPIEPLRVVALGEPTLSKRAIQTLIEFPGGVRAEIDLRIDSPVSMHTGWLLTGDCGGLADSRCYRVAKDGEVFDMPAPSIASNTTSYADLAVRLRAPDCSTTNPDRSATMIKLLSAIRESVQSNQTVTIANLA